MVFQPHSGFQIEVIGRFVEQQDFGRLKQGRSQSQTHAPTAGELPYRARQIFVFEAEAVQYSGCPRRRRSRFNHVQALVNFGKFIAGRGLQPLQKFGALTVSRKQKIQYRDVNIPHFLLNKNHPVTVGEKDRTGFGFQFAFQHAEQR